MTARARRPARPDRPRRPRRGRAARDRARRGPRRRVRRLPRGARLAARRPPTCWPWTSPSMEPSAGLKASLMATVRAEAPPRAPPASAEPATPRSRRRHARRSWLRGAWLRPWPAVAADRAPSLALLLGWNIALQTSDSDGRPRDVADARHHRHLRRPRRHRAGGLRARRGHGDRAAQPTCRSSPAGDAYQLWVIRDGTADLGRALRADRARRGARASRPASPGADALAVTAQPRTSRTDARGPDPGERRALAIPAGGAEAAGRRRAGSAAGGAARAASRRRRRAARGHPGLELDAPEGSRCDADGGHRGQVRGAAAAAPPGSAPSGRGSRSAQELPTS